MSLNKLKCCINFMYFMRQINLFRFYSVVRASCLQSSDHLGARRVPDGSASPASVSSSRGLSPPKWFVLWPRSHRIWHVVVSKSQHATFLETKPNKTLQMELRPSRSLEPGWNTGLWQTKKKKHQARRVRRFHEGSSHCVNVKQATHVRS